MEVPKYLLLATFFCCIHLARAVDKTIEAVLTATFAYSPAYEFGPSYNYASNTSYDYYIHTNYPGHNLSLTVEDCTMEQGDKNGVCQFDKLRIYDGPNNSSSLLDTFCCHNNANPTWTSSTNEVYMLFTSDATNNFRGFNISCVSFGPTTTTSTTSTTTTATTSTTSTTSTSTTSTTPAATTSTKVSTTIASGATTVAPLTAAPTATAASTGGANNNNSDDGGSDNNLYIIIGCVVGSVLLIIIIVLAVCYFLKKSKTSRATSPASSVHKRILWSRQTTNVKPFSSEDAPPGTVTQTNIFDMPLPDGRANLLPPLNSQLETAHPVVSPDYKRAF